MILDKVFQSVKEQGLDKYFDAEQRYMVILENRNHNIKRISNNSLTVSLPLNSPEDTQEKIMAIIKPVLVDNQDLELEFEKKMSVGDKLPNFGQIKKVFGQGTAELAAKDGQVLLIDVWATWCGPCQKPMAHNQEMLTKNNWGDKVRIVGVSVDDNVNVIKQRVESKGWQKVEHLTLNGWDGEHSLIKTFGVSGIPFVALTNTKGEIVFTGHPSSINLEEKINELIKEGSHPAQAEQKSKSAPISLGEVEKIADTVGKKQHFEEQFGKMDFLSTKITIVSKTSKQGKVVHTAEIEAYAHHDDKALLDQYQKLIPAGAKFKGKIVQSFEVPHVPETCCECKGALKYPLYWCKWGENPGDFRCRACVEKKVDEKTYHYKQNSVLLMEPVKRVAKSNLGQNIQPAKLQDVTAPNQFGCNGCGNCPESIGQARYVCAGCRSEPNYRGDYVDLCQDCLDKYAKGDADVQNSLTPDGHQKNHPFLRILYNVKGYYNF